jgi:hypothetical protein
LEELKSRPFDPHPLFASFIVAAVEQSRLAQPWAIAVVFVGLSHARLRLK